jgi:hypothetical protein
MSFVHDDPDFDGLLQIVANNRGLEDKAAAQVRPMAR